MLQPLSSAFTDPGSLASGVSPVSCVRFDHEEELLWAGNSSGHLTGLCNMPGGDLQRYSSFQVHSEHDVRAVLSCDDGILTLTEDQLNLRHRRGSNLFTYRSQIMRGMQCMEHLPSGLVLLGGHHKDLMEFDLERRRVIRTTELDEGCVIIRTNAQYVCTGDLNGRICLRDAQQMRVQHRFSAHSVTLSDFDVHGNYMITCGYSSRHSCNPDRFLMVYDLRMMQSNTPIPLTFAPYLLKFVPAFSTRFVVVSQTGKLQFLDVSTQVESSLPDTIHLQPGASITSLDISSTCQAFAFADNLGLVHLHGTTDQLMFNAFSRDSELPDAPETVPPSIAFDELFTPFSSVPMPELNETTPPLSGDKQLLSDWPIELSQTHYR
jgi:PAB-dependent poly(A)-specific ribonuclease subunit 2